MTDREILDLLNRIDKGYIPSAIEEDILRSLNELTLTEIDKIPNSLTCLSHLQKLDLRNSSKVNDISILSGLNSLKSFKAPGADIRDISPLSGMTSLTELDLSANTNLENIRPLTNLMALSTLKLQRTNVSDIDAIAELTALTCLNLSETQVSTLKCLSGLKSLTTLDISNNKKIKSVRALSGLSYMTKLNLSGTSIKNISCLKNMRAVEELSMKNINVKSIDSLANMKSITKLDLVNTQVEDINALTGLTTITYLDLTNTQVIDIGPLSGLTSLLHLNLINTPIQDINPLAELTSLEKLLLSQTKVQNIVPLRKLRALKILHLGNTPLKELPSWLGYLTCLKILVLENLTLVSLPESLLSRELPFTIAKCRFNSPDGIYIHGLKLKEQPLSLFKLPRKYIDEYYNQSHEFVPLNEGNIVFLGENSNCIPKIVDHIISDDNIPLGSNDSDNFRPTIKYGELKLENEECIFHFWDFTGVDFPYPLCKTIFSGCTFFIAVVSADCEKANDRVLAMVQKISLYSASHPVLILVEHKGKHEKSFIDEEVLYEECPAIKGVIHITSHDLTDQYIRNIRDEICHIAIDMEDLRVLIPKSWKALLKDFLAMMENYLASDVFQREFPGEQVNPVYYMIGWYLKQCELLYSNNSNPDFFREITPNRLLNGLCILFSSGKSYAVNGTLKESELEKLICNEMPFECLKTPWPNIHYEKADARFIILIMLKIGLMYEMEGDLLSMPLLCDTTQPEAVSSFVLGNVQHIRYNYKKLPKLMLYKLIASFSTDWNVTDIWRTGASFLRQDCNLNFVVRTTSKHLDIYASKLSAQKTSLNDYLKKIRMVVYQLNNEFGLNARENVAYRQNNMDDFFKYNYLRKCMDYDVPILPSHIFDGTVKVNELLEIVDYTDYQEVDEMIDQLVDILRIFTLRSLHFANRSEVEITADFQDSISAVMNCKYHINIAREYTLGRAKKTLGESDLYFYRQENGVRQDLFILENKYIKDFTTQYRQLLGYLNPYFTAGITLSINKTMGWEEAFDNIYTKLETLKYKGSTFAPISFRRITASWGTKLIKSEHVVPETGLSMPIYHLVLQLAGEERQRR